MIHAMFTQATLPGFLKLMLKQSFTSIILGWNASLFWYILERQTAWSRGIRSMGHRIILSASCPHKAITVGSQLTSLLEEALVEKIQVLVTYPGLSCCHSCSWGERDRSNGNVQKSSGGRGVFGKRWAEVIHSAPLLPSFQAHCLFALCTKSPFNFMPNSLEPYGL